MHRRSMGQYIYMYLGKHLPVGEEYFPPQEMMRFLSSNRFDSVQQFLVDSLAAKLNCRRQRNHISYN